MTFPRMPLLEPPLDPTSPEAKDLVLRELAKPEYTAARPSWFDRATAAFWEWISSLDVAGATGPDAFGLVVFIVLAAIGIVVAILVFGLPRLNRRAARLADVFEAADARSAANLRAAATAAAARGDLDAAVEEMFRALVRDLDERTIVAATPGMTADTFAKRAGAVFADHSAALHSASRAFDEVRYLGHPATAESWELIRELDARLRAARPALEVVAG